MSAPPALSLDLRQLVAAAAAIAPASAERLLASCRLDDDLAQVAREEVRAHAARPRDARLAALARALGPPPEPPDALGEAAPLLRRLRLELDAPAHLARAQVLPVRPAAPPSTARAATGAPARCEPATAHEPSRLRGDLRRRGHTLVRARHGA